jgi:hypothetical protein
MIDPTTGNYRDATFADLPIGTTVRVIAYGYGARAVDCGQTGTVIHQNRTRVIVHLQYGEVRPIAPMCLTPVPPPAPKLADILAPTTAQDLQRGQVIAFADDVCTVIGVDYSKGDEYVSLVTESPDGSQFVDYVSPVRIFTVIGF